MCHPDYVATLGAGTTLRVACNVCGRRDCCPSFHTPPSSPRTLRCPPAPRVARMWQPLTPESISSRLTYPWVMPAGCGDPHMAAAKAFTALHEYAATHSQS